MTYKVLIGRDVLRRGFLIDPSINDFDGFSKLDVQKFEKDNASENVGNQDE